MGMKAKSYHFSNDSNSGGSSRRIGKFQLELNLQFFAKMPTNKDQLNHIMGYRVGHIPDSPGNRQLFVSLTNDKTNYLGINKFGNEVYSKTVNGKQYWAYVRNNIIQNCGVNVEKHRDFSKEIIKK